MRLDLIDPRSSHVINSVMNHVMNLVTNPFMNHESNQTESYQMVYYQMELMFVLSHLLIIVNCDLVWILLLDFGVGL